MTDTTKRLRHAWVMSVPEIPNIISAERLQSGIVIKFDNGQCGFYASSYLFSKLPECEELNETDTEW